MPDLTPEYAREKRLIDELKTVIREAIDESVYDRGDGSFWVCGGGVVRPRPSGVDGWVPKRPGDDVRGALTTAVQQRVIQWLANRNAR
jgi:hypothetical protein